MLTKNAADKLIGEKDKIKSILDALKTRCELIYQNKKQNRFSLDMHAETIIMCNLVDMHSRNDAGEKKKRAPQNARHR